MMLLARSRVLGAAAVVADARFKHVLVLAVDRERRRLYMAPRDDASILVFELPRS